MMGKTQKDRTYSPRMGGERASYVQAQQDYEAFVSEME